VVKQDFKLLNGEVVEVAQRLLGCILVREIHGLRLSGRIVETEAYHQTDAASHSYKGRTPSTEIMFGPAGFLYVYFTYGMHYCMNVVTGAEDEGSAVLIRALEPLEGTETMRLARHGLPDLQLTNGPAKVCQALSVDKVLNGHDLQEPPLQLLIQPGVPESKVIVTTRIGISKNKDRRWRFYLKGNPYISRP
jgi:DNA-3-methyladenine glycosylase